LSNDSSIYTTLSRFVCIRKYLAADSRVCDTSHDAQVVISVHRSPNQSLSSSELLEIHKSSIVDCSHSIGCLNRDELYWLDISGLANSPWDCDAVPVFCFSRTIRLFLNR
jgi:hypothetical protein